MLLEGDVIPGPENQRNIIEDATASGEFKRVRDHPELQLDALHSPCFFGGDRSTVSGFVPGRCRQPGGKISFYGITGIRQGPRLRPYLSFYRNPASANSALSTNPKQATHAAAARRARTRKPLGLHVEVTSAATHWLHRREKLAARSTNDTIPRSNQGRCSNLPGYYGKLCQNDAPLLELMVGISI
jgi:hypothetical protein